MKTAAVALSLITLTGAAIAQDALAPAAIPAPKDVPYSGAIRLDVDATDLLRHLYRVHETIPVAGGGTITLLYPRWLPGNHSPSGRIEQLAGLSIRGNGKRIE